MSRSGHPNPPGHWHQDSVQSQTELKPGSERCSLRIRVTVRLDQDHNRNENLPEDGWNWIRGVKQD
jgi:hypothetical protein